MQRSSYKAPVILVRYVMYLEFSRKIFEKYLNINFHESRPVEPNCSMRTDGRTDEQTDGRTVSQSERERDR